MVPDVKGQKEKEGSTAKQKHSVEINVRIKRNRMHGDESRSRGRSHSHCQTMSSLQDHHHQQTQTPLAITAESHSFKRGSWGDLLRRGQQSDLVQQPQRELDPLETKTAATQTDDTSDNDKEEETALDTLEEYVTTIAQLHQLCSHLKEQIQKESLAKDRREIELLTIVKEKDDIIAAYEAQDARIPEPPPEQDDAQPTDVDCLHFLLRDMRNLMNVELAEMKHRVGSPLPHAPLYEKLLLEEEQVSLLNDTDHVVTEAGDARVTNRNREVSGNEELDSSTQYMDLPQKQT